MEKKNLVKKESIIPGIGVAGQVMCPLSLMAPKMCLKHGCEMWIELTYGNQKVARCALAWVPVLLVELRQEVERSRIKEK